MNLKNIARGKNRSSFRRKKWYIHLTAIFLLLLVSGPMLIHTSSSHSSAPPNTVTFSISNFNTALLSAKADDLSNTNCCQFHIQNSTQWWYGIIINSSPTGIQSQPASLQNDLVTTTFFGSVPLLPPVNVLPFEPQADKIPFETLQLQSLLYGTNQRLQLVLTPLEPHAVTLNILLLLMRILGQRVPTIQQGLLIPGTLTEIFALAGTMKDFTSLTSDYIYAMSSNTTNTEKYAQAFVNDMKALFIDPWEQSTLGGILWDVEGKVTSRESILTVIQSFSQVQFGLAVKNFIVDTALVQTAIFDQHHLPTISLQTPNTITPTPMPTPTPKPTPTPNAIATQKAQATQITRDAQATQKALDAKNAQATQKALDIINAQATQKALDIINAKATQKALDAKNAQATP